MLTKRSRQLASYYKNRNQLLNYYKNREERILYQREYDKNHKEAKRENDKRRRHLENYNKIQRTRLYSQKHHLPILLKTIGKCQIDGSTEKLEIHHLAYDTKKIEDCLLVCQPCHKKLHRKNIAQLCVDEKSTITSFTLDKESLAS